MVYAFIIQTLHPKEYSVLYYRLFTCYENKEVGNIKRNDDMSKVSVSITSTSSSLKIDKSDGRKQFCASKLFDTSSEKKDFVNHISRKVQFQHSLKMEHSLLRVSSQDDSKDTFVKGIFMERGWKNGSLIPVVWQGIPGLGFVIVCKENENHVQAQNILDVIIKQLEKHLQFISNPIMAFTLVETIVLVVNQFLPGGQLLYMNSKLIKTFEKQLESDLYSK